MLDKLTKEWVEKAEGDWRTLERLVGDNLFEVSDSICFHSQQCSEKYLKALLVREKISPPKIHNLLALLGMLVISHSELEELRSPCAQLSSYGVLIRYPGENASEDEAREALELAKEVRKVIREKLDL